MRARLVRLLTSFFALSLAGVGCAPRPAISRAASAPPPPVATEAASPVRGAPLAGDTLAWADFDATVFARAKAERRFVLLDGSAAWCHWCHVMEAETYRDPAIRRLLGERFVAAKVDIDARPDIADRYADYGWPATVIFSPDGEELGKYRGYLSPDELGEILRAVIARGANGAGAATADQREPSASASDPSAAPFAPPLTRETLALTARWTALALDDFFDDERGGWGTRQKSPCGWNDLWALERGRRGDLRLRDRALFTLSQERKLIDPVWGGMYQYSVNDTPPSDWEHPHFEKLMTVNALALASFASAYATTHDDRWRRAANDIRRWIEGFAMTPAGGFLPTQDADLNAHDPSRPFVDGHRYFALGDVERRALGLPRVDPHVYARENGLAIAAYAQVAKTFDDAGARAIAVRAAKHVLTTHRDPKGPAGALRHGPLDGPPEAVRFLADNAAMGWALVALDEATRGTPDADPRYLEAAQEIARFLSTELVDPRDGGLYAHTLDQGAVGVFATRRKPFDHGVLAVRFLLALHARARDPKLLETAHRALGALSAPETIHEQGRFLGDFLSALDEAGPLLPPTNGAAASAPTITSSSTPQRPPGRPNKVPLPSRRRRPAGCAPTCQPLRAPSSCPRPSPKS